MSYNPTYNTDDDFKIWVAAYIAYLESKGHTDESINKCTPDEYAKIYPHAVRAGNMALYKDRAANGGKSR